MIKVIRGNPTPEELAAALAVVQARAAAGGGPEAPEGPAAQWSTPGRIARAHVPHPSSTAWARTYWPA